MSEQIMNEIEMIRQNGLERFVTMVPEAMDELAKMLNEPMVPSNVKAQLIQMILDRGLGKAEETVNMNIRNVNMEEAYAKVQEMVDEIRSDMREKNEQGLWH
jgi:hypothetical protein